MRSDTYRLLAPESRTIQLLIVVQVLSLWPVWSWYLSRMLDRSDEPWGVLALVTALVYLVLTARVRTPTRSQIAYCLAAQGIYCYTLFGMPMLIQAVSGVIAAGVFLGVCLLYTSPSPRDRTRSRMPSSA